MKVSATAIALLLALAVASGCFWREDEAPVEWVERPEAIVIQMLDLGQSEEARELPYPIEYKLTVPAFTLYGNGTLIYLDTSSVPRFVEAQLPPDAMRNLVEAILDSGFMEYSYELGGANSHPNELFLYVNAKTLANSVAAPDSDAGLTDLTDEQREQLETVWTIRERLRKLEIEASGGAIDGEYLPAQTRLIVTPVPAPIASRALQDWPHPSIDLASIAPEGADLGEAVVPGNLTIKPWAAVLLQYEQDGRFYLVGFRPILPYEENFPEFDAPPP